MTSARTTPLVHRVSKVSDLHQGMKRATSVQAIYLWHLLNTLHYTGRLMVNYSIHASSRRTGHHANSMLPISTALWPVSRPSHEATTSLMALLLQLLIKRFPQPPDRIFIQPGGVEQTQYDQLRRTLWTHAVVPPKSKTFVPHFYSCRTQRATSMRRFYPSKNWRREYLPSVSRSHARNYRAHKKTALQQS